MQISGLPVSTAFGAADVLAIEINGVTYKITGATIAAALQIMGDYVTAQDIVNNLTTTEAGYVLDARQGKALLDAIEALGAADVGAVAADQGAANAGKALVVGNDGNVTTGKTVRPDAAQTLTAAEQAQARGNIGAASATELAAEAAAREAADSDLKSAINSLGYNRFTGTGTGGNTTNFEYKIVKGQTYNVTVSLASSRGTFMLRTKESIAAADYIETLYSGVQGENIKVAATENANVITIISNYNSELTIDIVSPNFVFNVCEDIEEEIKSEVDRVDGHLFSDKDLYISTIANGYVYTNMSVGQTVDITDIRSNSQFRYGIFPVLAGDKFVITGAGGGNGRLWCFTDATYKLLSVAGNSASATNLSLVAEQNGYLIVNFSGILTPEASGYVLKQVKCVDNIKNMSMDLYPFSGIDMFSSVAALGDSFTQGGMRNSDNTAWVTSKKTYPQVLGARHGITVTNYGRGGSTTKTYITDEYGLPAVLSATRKSLYIMSWGLNDAYKGMTLGSVSDIHDSDYTQNPDTFYGNYGKIISQLLAAFPLSRFVIFGPWLVGGIYSAYNDAAKKIAEHFSIGYCNPADDPFFTSAFYNNSLWGNHPIQPSYSGMAYAIERLLSREIVENYNYYKYTDIEPYTP